MPLFKFTIEFVSQFQTFLLPLTLTPGTSLFRSTRHSKWNNYLVNPKILLFVFDSILKRTWYLAMSTERWNQPVRSGVQERQQKEWQQNHARDAPARRARQAVWWRTARHQHARSLWYLRMGAAPHALVSKISTAVIALVGFKDSGHYW